MTIVALDSTGRRSAALQRHVITIKSKDTVDLTNGPGGKDCRAASERKDETPFDRNFACECTDGYSGPNCMVKADTALSGEAATDSGPIVGVVFAVFILSLVILAVAYKVHRRNVAMRPVDFESKFKEMIAAGFILDEDGNLTQDAPVLRELKRTSINLVDTLGSGQFGKCPVLDSGLIFNSFFCLGGGGASTVHTVLSAQKKTRTATMHRVFTPPQPTRLCTVFAGLVWKGVLDESSQKQGAATSFLVAAKTVKEDIADSVDAVKAENDLISEALLMAHVGTHKNLVSVIGVVTRGTPKMLVRIYENAHLPRSLLCWCATNESMLRKRCSNTRNLACAVSGTVVL